MKRNLISKNLREAREASGLTQSDLARALGISPQSVQQWEKGVSAPKIDRLSAVASVLGIPVEALTGNTAAATVLKTTRLNTFGRTDDFVSIPHLESALIGAEAPRTVEQIELKTQWLQQYVTCTAFTNLRALTALDNSMSPTFKQGDILLVDTGVNRVSTDAIYVLENEDRIFVKRVQRDFEGGLIIISDNKDYEKIVVHKNNSHLFSVVGRVTFAWSACKL